MMGCTTQQSFYGYFKENMEALGLSAPSSLFNTQAEAAGMLSALLTAINKFGRDATTAELAGATTGLEKLIVLGAMRASYYAGAALGSFAIAAGRYSACGTSLADVFFDIRKNGIMLPAWVYAHVASHPEILDKKHSARHFYAGRAKR